MSIRESIGTAVNLLVKVHDADLKAALQETLLRIQGEALDIQERVAQLQDENTRLSDELRKRDEQSEVANQLFYARHAYWRKDEDICVAYCPTCWDSNCKLIHLMHVADHGGYCNVCKNKHHYVYDSERPKEGDTAAPGKSNSPSERSYGFQTRRLF